MTCKDCIHYGVCDCSYTFDFSPCKFFKDKSKIIKLPCEIGGTVYTIYRNAVRAWTVVGAWISADPSCNCLHIMWYQNANNFKSMAVNFSQLDIDVFLTPDRALEELENRKKKDKHI